jgi:hypothetical protein
VIGFLKALFNWIEMRKATRTAWTLDKKPAAGVQASAGTPAAADPAPAGGAS